MADHVTSVNDAGAECPEMVIEPNRGHPTLESLLRILLYLKECSQTHESEVSIVNLLFIYIGLLSCAARYTNEHYSIEPNEPGVNPTYPARNTAYDWETLDDYETNARRHYEALADALRNEDTFDTTALALLPCEFTSGCILHEAIAIGVPENVLMLLAERFPIFLTQVDNNGRYPVHEACVFGTSVEFVSHCINMNPASVGAKDDEGKTPIQLLCQCTWQGSWDIRFNTKALENMKSIFWLLYQKAPMSVAAEGGNGLDTSEYAIRFNIGIELIRILHEIIRNCNDAKLP